MWVQWWVSMAFVAITVDPSTQLGLVGCPGMETCSGKVRLSKQRLSSKDKVLEASENRLVVLV